MVGKITGNICETAKNSRNQVYWKEKVFIKFMEMKMIDPKEELQILREMNRELMEENEHLRNQVRALEELAIDVKTGYNWDMNDEEFMEGDFDE